MLNSHLMMLEYVTKDMRSSGGEIKNDPSPFPVFNRYKACTALALRSALSRRIGLPPRKAVMFSATSV